MYFSYSCNGYKCIKSLDILPTCVGEVSKNIVDM